MNEPKLVLVAINQLSLKNICSVAVGSSFWAVGNAVLVFVYSSRPQSLAQGFVVERSDLQPAPVSPCVSYKRGLHVATVLLAPINLGVHRILFLT